MALSKSQAMMAFAPRGPLRGTARIPGDKSISHRALILASLAVGESRLEGLCDGADLRSTMAALAAMGARFDPGGPDSWSVSGVGTGTLLQPEAPLDLGNSGTSARLLMGLIASHPIRAILTGDRSLSRRPMERLAAPLRAIGARIYSSPSGHLPIVLQGAHPAIPRRHQLRLPSAQIKSALLLAGLNIAGVTEVIEAQPTRDHLERMLGLFGAEAEQDGTSISLRGPAELRPCNLSIPGDPSAAAFLVVAALIVPGSEIRIEGVGINPGRAGLFEILKAMGADIEIEKRRTLGAEPVADLVVRHSPLKGIEVPPELAPRMVDEFPILFVAAAFADGMTRTSGLAELRVKESDRLEAMATGLRSIGVQVTENADGLEVEGSAGESLKGGAAVQSKSDHRVAMSFAIAGLNSAKPLFVDDMNPVQTSFPGFLPALEALSPS